MSFIHYLSAGHFRFASRIEEPDWMTVERPLDPAIVTELLARFADDGRIESPTFDAEPMKWEYGYVTGRWWTFSKLNTAFLRFAVALGERTDCQLADLRCCNRIDLAGLRDELAKYAT